MRVRQDFNAIAADVGTAGADGEDASVQDKQKSKDASSVGEDPAASTLEGSTWVLQGEGLHIQDPTCHHQHPQVWTAPQSAHSPVTVCVCDACIYHQQPALDGESSRLVSLTAM